MDTYSILLFYCYTNIYDPESFRRQHQEYCIKHKLRGRIIVAHEGINGTISGLNEMCEKYMRELKADARFANIEFKVEPHHQHAFKKINVRVKDEIVNSSLKHIDPNEKTGQHLTPEEFRKKRREQDVILLDVRSNYEHRAGRFKDAITLDIDHFRDFPGKIDALEHLKDKKIITYCTGGIKCEKASAYLLEKGFKNVYQLHGGIIRYGQESGGEDFEGTCYVFDNRITAEVNKINPTVISTCHHCGKSCDRMVNCANPECNNHLPICPSCAEDMEGACSEVCRQHPKKRKYNGTGHYSRELNGYNPYIGLRVDNSNNQT